MMVYSGSQRVSDQAMPASVRAPLVAGNSDDDAAPAVVAGTVAAPANQIARATAPMPRVEPALPSPPSPSSLPSQTTAARANATAVSGSPSLSPQVANAQI